MLGQVDLARLDLGLFMDNLSSEVKSAFPFMHGLERNTHFCTGHIYADLRPQRWQLSVLHSRREQVKSWVRTSQVICL